MIRLTVGPIARARNGVFGKGDGLPWRIRSDLQMFKALTLGKPIIMGRKTWESLPRKPLPGRMNIVLSRDASFEPAGALACESLADAIGIAREQAADDGAEEVCVIGGASVVEAALPKASRIYFTEVEGEPEGDVILPPLDETGWAEVRREHHERGPEDDFAYTFRVLERQG